MEILGLDMIKKESDEVNITGLDKIKQIFHNDLPKMSSFATEFIGLVNLIRESDTNFEEFGSELHRYEFNPVIPLSKVKDFECRHQITLPQGYVDFLTQVGNGGAGPAYGFYSLEQLEIRNHSIRFFGENEQSVQTFSFKNNTPVLHTSEFDGNEWIKTFQALSPQNKYEYESRRSEILNGLLVIASYGCGRFAALVYDGELFGQIGFVDIEFHSAPSVNQITFEEFALKWAKDTVKKYQN